MICTRLRLGHLSICFGESSWDSEEIVKILNCAFECDYYYYYQYYYYYYYNSSNNIIIIMKDQCAVVGDGWEREGRFVLSLMGIVCWYVFCFVWKCDSVLLGRVW